ncbi:MAG: glycosyltransferase family A protein [Eubacteriales bacterium]|jgi:glycosyltransferase involved in cell wall biosynthesis|nr:glycosyltransferase family 2 protein [Lachnospiraceae bacterium]MDD5860268.1 glycosyltransferase family A protein [Eubacteriales bacterium]MCH4064280.1 glycosyltransferase family 2 protein [Lachnospiraceae bacterium]MCH4102995.1 glycosyltransferase family 2 protein [Lachnospiraceae bacterium]MCI1308984.1 glycosyltransferase family 2 protein [Lachnospiraceae bacterium]
MKILTVAIPCYNSEAYMRKAIDHAMVGGDDVEVLIIDDGSKDGTLDIAREYEKRFPTICRAIHQENKGHGGAVNTGIAEASGVYFKVCDSDDWLDYDSYMKVLDALRACIAGPTTLDCLFSNYIYEKQGAKRKHGMRYVGTFPEDRIFTWNDIIKPLNTHRYVLMHSIIYRTQLLRDCGLELPEHTFYVDNIYAFTPMMYVKTMYYCNVPLYRYFIGRSDQSVNEKVMVGRMDQQIRVTKIMIDSYRPELVKNKNMASYMIHDMGIIMSVTSILLLRIGTDAALEQKKEIWNYLKKKDLVMYLRIRHSVLGRALNIPTKAGRDIAVKGYQLVQKYYGFN